MTYIKYWISGHDVAIFRVGKVPADGGILLKDFKHPMIFEQNVEESCTFQKIYGVGKVILQTNG
jgi:hypothetical protein